VIALNSFSSDFDGQTRVFTVDFACNTISGNLELDMELP
jgi:hypothetical protein